MARLFRDETPDRVDPPAGAGCTRHRHACVVVGRVGDRQLLEGLPPSTPAWPGAHQDDDEVLRGWQVHRDVFAALVSHRVTVQ